MQVNGGHVGGWEGMIVMERSGDINKAHLGLSGQLHSSQAMLPLRCTGRIS